MPNQPTTAHGGAALAAEPPAFPASAMRLTESEIEASLVKLPAWSVEREALQRSFRFANFTQAFAFMTAVAQVAEDLNHHPDWRNAFNRVEISLTTHDAGGLTALDFALAAEIDRLAQRF